MLILHALYFVFGLVVGSFLNVCIYRIPRREEVVFRGSHCPRCGCAIRPWDNIPLVSYLLLRGRCRSCGMGISPQYPAVELITGMAFLACGVRWAYTSPSFVNALFLALVTVLVFVDYQHQVLPNVITLPGTVAGILLSPLQTIDLYRDPLSAALASALRPQDPDSLLPWAGSVAGSLIGAGVLLVVSLAYRAVRKRHGLGMGDVKMMAMVGAFLGWRMAMLTIFAGSFGGSILGIFLVLFRGKTMQHKLAFGTFLGAGAAAALFLGSAFIEWYTAPR